MTKDQKDFEAWVKKQIDFYKPFLGIDLEEIDLKYQETKYIEISFVYPYLEPVIFYHDKAIESWKKGGLTKKTILHELVHTITDPLYSVAIDRCVTEKEIEDTRERLTDKITVILNNLIK